MADNITIPATGSGTATPVVATDDAGAAGHVQIVKLAIATDGSATLIPADATAGLACDPTDDALRDLGKVDVASLDQYTPVAGRLPVDGSGVTQPVSNAGLTELAAAINASSQMDVNIAASAATVAVSNAALSVTGGGVEATALRVTVASDSTGVLSVDDNGASLTVDNAGLTALNGAISGTEVQVDVLTLPNVTLAAGTNTNEVVGDAAHGAAQAGNPLCLGATAETALSGITAVADGQISKLYCGVDGVLITRPHCNLEDAVQDRATNTDGASTAFAGGLAAPGANVRIWLTSVTLANSSATDITVDLRDGAAGSVLWTFPVPAGGGVTHTWTVPLKFTANTAVAYDGSAAATTLTISANGFKSKV